MDQARLAQATLDAMARADVLSPACPSRAVLQHLTSRWGVLVLAVLATGTFRFAALRRRIGGVSERMLAQTLQQLEGDGFVHRRDHGKVPPHVDYTLTPLGRAAAQHVVGLVGWIEGNLGAILAHQAARGGEAADLSAAPDRTAPASA